MLLTMTTPEPETLRIGDLASRTGVTVETLRYYEQRGLLHPSARRSTGYREYGPQASRLVQFIKRAQSLGFTLGEVKELVRLREAMWDGDATKQLRDAALAKVNDIDRRLRELQLLRRELGEILAECDDACAVESTEPAPAECPIVQALEDVEPPTKPGRRRAQNQSLAKRVQPTRRPR